MRVYRNENGNWKYEHMVLLGAVGGGVPSKDVLTPPCIVSPTSSIRIIEQKWTVGGSDAGTDTDNNQNNIKAYLTALPSVNPVKPANYIDVEYLKSNDAQYSMKVALFYWFEKNNIRRVWMLCSGFFYYLKNFTVRPEITKDMGLLPYTYLFNNQGVQESLYAANSAVQGAYVMQEFSYDNFSSVQAQDLLDAMRINIPNIKFPRFVAQKQSSSFPSMNELNDTGYRELSDFLKSEAEWYEEDYDVTTEWTKPQSVLDMINGYILGDYPITDGASEIWHDRPSILKALWNADTGSGIFSSGLYNDPMQAILGLHIIPFHLPLEQRSTTRQPVYVGKKAIAGVSDTHCLGCYKMTNEYVEYLLGNNTIERIFNDYRDYTEVQIQLYLPCIGWKTLDAQTYMGKQLVIKYRVNFVTGDIVALLITKPGDIIQDTVKGNACQNLPLSGSDRAKILQAQTGETIAALSGFVGLAGGAITGNPAMAAGALTASATSLMQAKANTSIANASIQKSGNIGSCVGFLSYPNAYLLISYHEDAMPTGYQNYEGYQSNKILTVNALTGYIKAREVYFSSARATEQEKEMVESMLKEGVFK